MIEKSPRIFIQHPNQPDSYIHGQVMATKDRLMTVRFAKPVPVFGRQPVQLYYHDANNRFTRVPGQVVCVEAAGEQPVVKLSACEGEQEDDHRQSFRVNIRGLEYPIEVDGCGKGYIANISCEGMGILVEYDGFSTDQWIDLSFEFDLQVYRGRFCVRNWSKKKDGWFRYGLMADTSDTQLINALTLVTQELQKQRARRASRIASARQTDLGTPSMEDYPDDDFLPPDGAEQQTPDLDGIGGPGCKRQHKRMPWTGMAKVYIREEQNLRVLDVKTADLSQGGMSFICNQYIYKGAELLFEKTVNGELFRIRGVVRSIHIDKSIYHRVGVEFLGPRLQPNDPIPEFAGSFPIAV